MAEKKISLSDNPKLLASECVKILYNKKARDIKMIYVEEQTVIAEYYVICCGRSSTNVKALADEVEYKLGLCGVENCHVEGRNNGGWILLDFGSVLVHVFSQEMREYYKLEKLYNADNEIDISGIIAAADSEIKKTEVKDDEA